MIGVSYLDDLGVEIEPMAMLEDMVDDPDDEDDDLAFTGHHWGTDDADSLSRSNSDSLSRSNSDSLSRSNSQYSSENSTI